ncbi:hypothetical protein [Lysinibacillus antri]|uniref:Phage tail tape measure protein n=1 Tax=Lysinibacillus antri TaxID=2498145 RepID=A0A3S0WFK2_9BACI|nr:hypothetical protein [Lysinibacillus antri]RUL51101.1 hypothetical protein EK386_12900 [Lysinibacillus antri]
MIDLVARLRMKDDFSSPMQKAIKKMEQASKSAEKLEKASKKSASSFNGFGGGVKSLAGGLTSVVSKLNPVAMGIAAVGAAAASAYASVKVFNATVGEAMKMQQSQVMIGAMFDNEKLSKEYMKMMDSLAINSPLLDSQTMYGNSKSFVALSKDSKELSKMWKLTEKLVASDPSQGVEGAVFALRELFSGDAISIVDRFEMSRDVMNEIKKLPLEQQLKRLDEYFNKLGFSDKLIADMGETALGKWTQVKERWQLIMRDIGEKSLGTVSDFLNKTLARLEGEPMRKFSEFGGKIISQMVSGLSNGAVKLYDYLTQLTSSPEFKKRTTITGKVDFIVSDIADKISAWYEGGGKTKIETAISKVSETIIGVLNNSDKFATLGVSLGNSLASGIMQGVSSSIKESWLGKYLAIDGAMLKYTNPVTGVFNAAKDLIKYSSTKKEKGSYYHGIDYVPTDRVSQLHKGEMVLPRQEAKAYREGGGNGFTFNYNGTMQIREEADIQKVALALYTEFRREAAQRGI